MHRCLIGLSRPTLRLENQIKCRLRRNDRLFLIYIFAIALANVKMGAAQPFYRDLCHAGIVS